MKSDASPLRLRPHKPLLSLRRRVRTGLEVVETGLAEIHSALDASLLISGYPHLTVRPFVSYIYLRDNKLASVYAAVCTEIV